MNKQKKSLTLRIPKGLLKDLNICLKIHIPNFNFTYNIEYFLYIIHKVSKTRMYNKFKNLQKVPISSKILRYEIGKHYKRYLEYLIEHEFITTDNHYIVSQTDTNKEGKCKCYGIGKRYKEKETEEYELTKKSILKKVLEWKNKKFGKMVNDELLGHLYEMIQKIEIDMVETKKYLDMMVKEKKLSKYKAHVEMLKCERINDKEDPYSLYVIKDTYGRIHTNLTNISKYIRENFIYIEGEKVIGLDIISSQPALLYTLFKEYLGKIAKEVVNQKKDEFHVNNSNFNNPVDIRDKYVNLRNNYFGEHIYKNEFNPLINSFGHKSLLEMLEKGIKELDQYKNVLEHASLYEFFKDQWEFLFGDNIDRKEIKKEWMKFVFGQKGNPFNDKMKIIWDREFPLLTKILEHFKNGNYRFLAQELQRKEANIMFKELCPKIDKMNIKYFTVHDSIMVKESVVNQVYDVFNEVLEENDVVSGVYV